MSEGGPGVVVVGGLKDVCVAGREVDEADSEGVERECLIPLHRCHDVLGGFDDWIVQSTEKTGPFR